MQRWTVQHMQELAGADDGAGESFYVRRVLQRLERGELDVLRAIVLLRQLPAGGVHSTTG